MDRAIDDGARRRRVGDIAAGGDRPPAGARNLLEQGFRERLGPPEVYDDGRAGLGERPRDDAPDPARRARDERGVPRKIDRDGHDDVPSYPNTTRMIRADNITIVASLVAAAVCKARPRRKRPDLTSASERSSVSTSRSL
jgi:hypothetical protein